MEAGAGAVDQCVSAVGQNILSYISRGGRVETHRSGVDDRRILVVRRHQGVGKIFFCLCKEGCLTGWNTARRLGDAYREAVDQVLESPSFPYDCHIGFGDLEFIPEEYKNEPDVPSYALITNELELDGIYDINELGVKAGKLTIYIYDDTVTVERLAEIILDIKGMLDDAGIGFYVMDCVLEYPKPESGEWKQGRVEVIDFLSSDIYETGLVERVQTSNDAANEYYDEMDALKKKEEN